MNYIKIQTELLKMLDREDKRNQVLAGVLNEEEIAVTLDGYALYRIPKNRFYIDHNKIPGNQLKAYSFFDFETEDATKTNELRKVKKVTLVKIKSANAYAWVDEKLLRLFDKECSFAISKKKPLINPIKVFEDGACVGIVLPYKVEG